ncbi:hypothetical protein B296_00017586 [Ensete ventricosum]|uniref:CLAVATA3/ESR-like protein n=1 Tax=Ensete ventricosum TaxID=4639 RepID=A0A426YV70_ENSVE|nr:hypothetical protein B296_00017586 [Ensete ventricosum]
MKWSFFSSATPQALIFVVIFLSLITWAPSDESLSVHLHGCHRYPHHYQYHHRAESSWWSHGPPARCHRFPLGELQPPPQPPSSREEIDPRYGVQKRLVPTGPNPLHN